jgi:hypothetical protein
MQPISVAPVAADPGRLVSSSAVRSPGVLGSALILLALPLAVISSLLGITEGVVVHLCLAAGMAALAVSALQVRLLSWLGWAGAVAMAGLGVIFLLQGLADLTGLDALRTLAYGPLGQWPERLTGNLVLLWFWAPLLLLSRGSVRWLGFGLLGLASIAAVLRWLPFSGIVEPLPAIVDFLIAVAWYLAFSVQLSRRSTRGAPDTITRLDR